MERTEITKKIISCLKVEYKTVSIDEETALEYSGENSLDMSSMDIIDFIIQIEEEFCMIVDISTRFETIGDVVNYIHSKLNGEETL